MKKLLLFTTPYCEPCKAFKPIFISERAKYHDVSFSIVDATEERELARKYKVRSVPTLVLLDDNGVQIGYKSEPYNEDDIYRVVMG
ncbi:MAG: thioredoxin [Negativicutes bacterium]|nr:thioredoxin [Negativicutes bacterium]